MWFRGVRFRSTLEADWAATFESWDIHWQYEPEAVRIDQKLSYLPDFWLPSIRVWAEAKGPLDTAIHKPRDLQRALQREHRGEWDFTCPFVVILRPSENGTAMWEAAAPGSDPVIVLCPNCQHFGFMDYDGAWRCRRYCKTKTNKFWNEPGGGIWWPGELPFIRAPRSGR
jgi:hypothetical protein